VGRRGPSRRRRLTRPYAVTVEGTQSTTWSYNRDADRGDGCRIIANGSGKEYLIFTTRKPVETELLRDRRGRPETSVRWVITFRKLN
jgi:hypothetical protein